MNDVMVSQKQERVDPEEVRTRALARLRQAVWEAPGSYDDIRDYVESVLREMETDEP